MIFNPLTKKKIIGFQSLEVYQLLALTEHMHVSIVKEEKYSLVDI